MAVTMRQPTPTLPITSKMLRHFAVVTVAITACIGIFAQGENAEVAAKPAQAAAPQESGGGKPTREVNGIKLASGTKLNPGGGDDSGGGGGGGGEGSGYIQSPQSAIRPTAYGPAANQPEAIDSNGYAAQATLAPVPKDANGVPAPGAAISTVNPARPGKPKPPRRATAQEIERMMAASSRRTGRATTD